MADQSENIQAGVEFLKVFTAGSQRKRVIHLSTTGTRVGQLWLLTCVQSGTGRYCLSPLWAAIISFICAQIGIRVRP